MRARSRSVAVALLATVSLALAPQAQAAGKFTYYLHHKGGCVNGAKPGPFMNLKNDADDDDGCGAIGSAGLFGGELGAWTSDKASGAPVAVPSGARVKAALFMGSAGLVQLTAELYAGKTLVGTGTSEELLTVELLDFDRFDIAFRTTKAIPKGSPVTLKVSGGTTAQWYWGYEDDHPSNVEISF